VNTSKTCPANRVPRQARQTSPAWPRRSGGNVREAVSPSKTIAEDWLDCLERQGYRIDRVVFDEDGRFGIRFEVPEAGNGNLGQPRTR
jgi:hypothetical protein